MKLGYILLVVALLMPLAFSESAIDDNSRSVAGVLDLAHSVDHAQDATVKASEKVFVGSIKSNKYHYPICQWAQKIKPENEIWFSSSQDARNQGYVPCKVCSPP